MCPCVPVWRQPSGEPAAQAGDGRLRPRHLPTRRLRSVRLGARRLRAMGLGRVLCPCRLEGCWAFPSDAG